MKMLLQLSSLIVIMTTVTADIVCDACVEGYCYEEHEIRPSDCPPSGLGDLTIDRTTDTIYYRSYVGNRTHRDCAFNLKDNRTEIISIGVKHHIKYIVDETTGIVYEQPNDKNGLYKYNPITKKTEHILPNVAVECMFFKDKLYYSDSDPFDNAGLYTLKNGVIEELLDLDRYSLTKFIVDKNDDIYFLHQSGNGRTFLYRNGANNTVALNNITNVKHLSIDKDGNVVLGSVYSNPFSTKMHRIKDDQLEVFGVIGTSVKNIIFDSENNIIYRRNRLFRWYHLRRNGLKCSFRSDNATTVINVGDKDFFADYEHEMVRVHLVQQKYKDARLKLAVNNTSDTKSKNL